ncbi:MAG: motility protein MotB [Alphaproteobacteria bacterium]|nr:motility protein MotB [Alphaproteobacteria bacterium]
MAKKKGSDDEKPVIIKKVIKKGGGHHGGAWKVAYADFVTAMMAFFLLLWLLNVATDEQLMAISGYFDPTHPRVSAQTSGAGGVLGGLSMTSEGAMATRVNPFVNNPPSRTGNQERSEDEESEKSAEGDGLSGEAAEEQERFEEAIEEVLQAIQESPELEQLMKNVIVDITPEGLRIQIVDQAGESMFPSGSAQMYEKTEKLMRKVGDVIKSLPNNLSVRGHTDSVPYGPGADYTNWELSTDRANASRRVLKESGFPEARIFNVVGKADKEHLLPDAPNDPRNRRITLVLLREKVDKPEAKEPGRLIKRRRAEPKPPEPGFEKTEGEVYFP